MATLVSPGVQVQIVDQSQYGASGPGTVPLLVIATAANKVQSGTTTIAPGTTAANAGQLWLITSQRDSLTTFGTPTYYSAGGTVEQNNELNEIGLFSLYEYLGIANQAYVLRANVDLAQLIPTSTAPVGPPTNNQNWLNLSTTTFGLFRSNGNSNPAFSWQAQSPLVISSLANLEVVKQGHLSYPNKITSGSSAIITAAGNLIINGISTALIVGDTLSSVASKINSNVALGLINISATVFSRVEKIAPNASPYGVIYSLRLVCSNAATVIDLTGSNSTILSNLGLSTGHLNNVILPASSYGTAGNLAINTLASADGEYRNDAWEKITVVGAADTDWWFKVGSTETNYPGWSWTAAEPIVITGTNSNPVFTPGDICTITVAEGSPITVTVAATDLTTFVSTINTALNVANVNVVATVSSVGSFNYLQITNYDGTDIQFNNSSDQTGTLSIPFTTAGIPVNNVYWSTVTGTVANPTFVASNLLTSSATVVASGNGYVVGDNVTVVGGTATTASNLTVASDKVVHAAPHAGSAGTGYAINDTLTFSGAGYTTPVILTVSTVSGGAITGVTITQAGQFTGAIPSNPATPTSTSGSGSLTAIMDLFWGVNTFTVSIAGNYQIYPTGNVTLTGGSGTGATAALTSGFLQNNTFTIDPGTGIPVLVHIPASPNNTLAGVVNQINNVAFPNGPIVASATNNFLTITNTNGTSFVLQDDRGLSLNGAGIPTGTVFGRKLVYQGWQPTLTPPSLINQITDNNIWINTTPGNQGANYVVQTYINGVWTPLNIYPNTGTIPMYSSTAAADAGFGGLKQIGSTFAMYNADGYSPAEASQILYQWSGSAWIQLVYTPSSTSPFGAPVDGTLWYSTNLQADIMVNNGTQWLGYRNAYPATDPNGVILSSSAPIAQSTLAPLVDYDMWLQTDVTPYPVLYRYNVRTASWILVNNTDHSSSQGIIFADARPNSTGTATGSTTQASMVISNYIDTDAPNALLYPSGMLLFNSRYSTYNVKKYESNYFPNTAWPARWVTASGNAPNGTPYMGATAQRQMVVEGILSSLSSNQAILAEQNFYNLLAAPGYPEAIADLLQVSTNKNNVAFVVGDTPSTLASDATSIQNWATNANNASEDGPIGLVTESPYIGLYYPWGLGTNLDGTSVIVPPSMMALMTIAYNDQVAYPWFAPAGFNRGLVSSATSVGYVGADGDFVTVTLNQGQRDVLYTNKINPIAYMPGQGLVIWGQKTLDPNATALDRINVTRLVCYLAYQLDNLAKPFLFEQNDTQTRANVVSVFNAFMNNLVATRALYDFSVVCDTSNNTPDLIDQNQLWIDIAIQPEKTIEFIYIPVRILNTGAPLPGGSAVQSN